MPHWPSRLATFPLPAHRTRRAAFRHRALQWDHAARTRVDPAPTGMARPFFSVRVAGVARPRPLPAGRRTWRQACSRPAACACRPGLRSFLHSLPFAFACGGSSSLEHNAGVLGTATPGVLRAFPHLSSPEAPSLRGHYPASAVVRAFPPPCPARPAPRGAPVAACCITSRASRVAASFLFHACQRHYPGGCWSVPVTLSSRPAAGLPPNYERVGSRVNCFEACSAFTRVLARMVAEPPKAAL